MRPQPDKRPALFLVTAAGSCLTAALIFAAACELSGGSAGTTAAQAQVPEAHADSASPAHEHEAKEEHADATDHVDAADSADEPGTVTSDSPAEQDETTAASAEDGPAAQAEENEPVAVVDPQLLRGQQLFAKHCSVCHGASGDGQGKFAYLMNPRPRNFQDEHFKLYTTQNQIPSDADLYRTISRGMPGSAMPPWGHLPVSDLQALVAFVRSVKVQAVRAGLQQMVDDGDLEEGEIESMLADRTKPGHAIVVPPESTFDHLRWFNGRKVYMESCASCHGEDGRPVASAVKFDEQGYPVPPRSFVDGIFKGGSEGHQLYARIVRGLRGTPMPAFEGAYGEEDIWDLIHYVQSLSRAGAQERAQLRMNTIAASNITGPLPAGPTEASWDQARPVYVGLTPLWWTEERIEGLMVQALHNEKELALRLSWIDPTQDTRAVGQHEFRDGVAVQFSLTPDPPFYMGDAGKHGGVNIWYWKADRHRDLADGRQDIPEAYPNKAVDLYQPYVETPSPTSGELGSDPKGLLPYMQFITAWASENLVANPTLKTAVECLTARGPGTLSGAPANMQIVAGQAAFERGVWYVQMQRTLDLPHDHAHGADSGGERVFKPGDYLPVSFAIWNGSAGDRDGKKNISIWQKLVIE
jgi:mono/diheme cytochrome c family protein